MTPYSDPEGHRSRRQRARGEPAGAEGRDPRRHRLRDDQPAARRRPARHRGQGGRAQLADRRQDRHDRRLHATRGSSASIRTSRSACGSATIRRSRSGTTQTGAEAALPIWIDIMKAWIGDRKEPPDVRAARQHRLRVGRQGHRASPPSGTPGAISRGLHRRHAAGVGIQTVAGDCSCQLADSQIARLRCIADCRISCHCRLPICRLSPDKE